VEGKNTVSVEQLVADAARHLGDGNAEAAIAMLSLASAQDPNDLRIHFLTALVAWSLHDTAKALALTQSCFDRDPGNGTFAEALASLYAQAGELLESLYYGKLAIALPPNETMRWWLPTGFPTFEQAFLSIQSKPLLAQARLFGGSGRLVRALDKARQHVEVAPDDAEGRLFYAELLLRAGQAAPAAEILQPLTQAGTPEPAAASLLAKCLAAIGDATSAVRWHDRACTAAPDDAAIAAGRIADAPWIGADRQHCDGWVKDWLARFTRPAKPRHWRAAGDTLVIGYLVSHFADRGDAAAVAAVARAHARAGASVIGYGLGAQSWGENALLGGAFDKWRDITGVDHATLAKMFAGDGLAAVIDVGGFASPGNLRALAQVNTAVRVAWLADARGLGHRIYDAVLAPRAARFGAAEIALWHAPCGDYPLLRDWSRPAERTVDPACRFGADVSLAQIDAETTALWRAVLEASPKASLLLHAHDLSRPANVARLIDRFGTGLASRIDVVAAEAADEFYRQVDAALAPARGLSARLTGEALAHGVPVIAFDNGGPWQPYSAMLRELGLAPLVTAKPEEYVQLATGLAASGEKRAQAVAAVAPVAARGEGTAGEIAAAIESAVRAMLCEAAA